ncbi:hypothetical protein FXO37_30248 [Capsicum annuum]|nr:hypothetical protein FXO37_30248 [Capsicum annuum]
MTRKAKEFTSSDLNVQENFVCVWTNTMDDTLVDAYCHEDALGHRVGGTFTTHAMDNIVKKLQFKFPDKVINKEKIHNRMKIIKRQFTKYYDTFHQLGKSGFAWDPITHKWDAEPEVWDQLIQAKPQADEFKNKSFQNYEKLVMLYGKDRATEKHAETEAPAPTRNKKSKHEHLEGMTDVLRSGMDNWASAINRLSSLPPISETKI